MERPPATPQAKDRAMSGFEWVYQAGIWVAVFACVLSFTRLAQEVFGKYRETLRENLARTARELNKFFFTVKPKQILLTGGLLAGLLWILTRSWVLAVTVMIATTLAPKFLLKIWIENRSKKVDRQLMDALILMNNTVKSGLDIVTGIELVSTNLKPPISEEFGLVLNAYRLGTPLEQALLDMLTRTRSRSLETVVYAINIQRESGGDITQTFDQMVHMIREEMKLQDKVRSLTAQGRTQIYFLAVFPWILAVGLYWMAPEFVAPALRHPIGQMVFAGLILWECIGIAVTKKIVEVEV